MLAILHLLGMFVADWRCRFEAENLFLCVGPTVVCAENFVRIDLVRESLTVLRLGKCAKALKAGHWTVTPKRKGPPRASGTHTSRVRRLSSITREPWRKVIGALGQRWHAARAGRRSRSP